MRFFGHRGRDDEDDPGGPAPSDRQLAVLVELGRALAYVTDQQALRTLVNDYIPRVTGAASWWIVLRRDHGWEVFAGSMAGAHAAIEDPGFAPLATTLTLEIRRVGDALCFPLVAGGDVLGVLGLVEGDLPLDGWTLHALEAASALLGVTLRNAQLLREVRENVRDGLTGCFTRAYALEVIEAELARARRSRLPVAVVMFDLDHFKDINDRWGHLCGDAVLAAVGRRMRAVLRGSDLKCRWGGEEFLVLLPETPVHGARRVAETLRREIAERPIFWEQETLMITASFGVTEALPEESDIQALIGRADTALYQAKRAGRNTVKLAGEVIPGEGRFAG